MHHSTPFCFLSSFRAFLSLSLLAVASFSAKTAAAHSLMNVHGDAGKPPSTEVT